MLLGLSEPTSGTAARARPRSGAQSARRQAPRRLSARQRRLLRRHDRPSEPALHGAAQRHRPQGRRGSHRRAARARRPDRRRRQGGRQRTRAACASASAWPTCWSRTRRSSSSTSRRPRSTRPASVEVLELVRELARDGAAVLLASHLLHQVQQVCDRVGIFVSGKLVASGPMEKLAGAARHRARSRSRSAPDRSRGRRSQGVADGAGRDIGRARSTRHPDRWWSIADSDVRADICPRRWSRPAIRRRTCAGAATSSTRSTGATSRPASHATAEVAA